MNTFTKKNFFFSKYVLNFKISYQIAFVYTCRAKWRLGGLVRGGL